MLTFPVPIDAYYMQTPFGCNDKNSSHAGYYIAATGKRIHVDAFKLPWMDGQPGGSGGNLLVTEAPELQNEPVVLVRIKRNKTEFRIFGYSQDDPYDQAVVIKKPLGAGESPQATTRKRAAEVTVIDSDDELVATPSMRKRVSAGHYSGPRRNLKSKSKGKAADKSSAGGEDTRSVEESPRSDLGAPTSSMAPGTSLRQPRSAGLALPPRFESSQAVPPSMVAPEGFPSMQSTGPYTTPSRQDSYMQQPSTAPQSPYPTMQGHQPASSFATMGGLPESPNNDISRNIFFNFRGPLSRQRTHLQCPNFNVFAANGIAANGLGPDVQFPMWMCKLVGCNGGMKDILVADMQDFAEMLDAILSDDGWHNAGQCHVEVTKHQFGGGR